MRQRLNGLTQRSQESEIPSSPSRFTSDPQFLSLTLAGSKEFLRGHLVCCPFFYHDGPPAESCVSGELWQIAFGLPGEQIFVLPEFDGKSNLGGHQGKQGV